MRNKWEFEIGSKQTFFTVPVYVIFGTPPSKAIFMRKMRRLAGKNNESFIEQMYDNALSTTYGRCVRFKYDAGGNSISIFISDGALKNGDGVGTLVHELSHCVDELFVAAGQTVTGAEITETRAYLLGDLFDHFYHYFKKTTR